MFNGGLRTAMCAVPAILLTFGCSSGRQFTLLPSSPYADQLAMARSYEKSGELTKAKQVYAEILAQDPNAARVKRRMNALAMVEERIHRVAIKEKHSKSAIPSDQNETLLASAPSVPGLQTDDPDVPPLNNLLVASNAEELYGNCPVPAPVGSDLPSNAAPTSTVQNVAGVATEIAIPLLLNSAAVPVTVSPVYDVDLPPLSTTTISSPSPPMELQTTISTTTWVADEPVESTKFELPIVRKTSPLATIEDLVPPEPAVPAHSLFAAPAPVSAPDPIRQINSTEAKVLESPLFGEFNIKLVQIVQEKPESTQPILMRVLGDPSIESRHRARAAFLLGTLGTRAQSALPVFRKAIDESSDHLLTIELAASLLEISPNDEAALLLIVNSLRDLDPQVQWSAAVCLRKCAGPKTTNAIPLLIKASKTSHQKLKRMMFLTLAAYGKAATDAIPELQAALLSSDEETRSVAAASLASIAH